MLYLRSEGARIFDVTATAPIEEESHEVPPSSAPQPKRGASAGAEDPACFSDPEHLAVVSVVQAPQVEPGYGLDGEGLTHA